jgi:integrase
MNSNEVHLSAQHSNFDGLIERVQSLVMAAKSKSTRKNYRSCLQDFELFCASHQLPFLPSTPETVAIYIAQCSTRLSLSSIVLRLSAITAAHKAAGFAESPASPHHFIVGETLKGLRRTIGVATKGKAPLLAGDIRRLLAACPNGLLGARDQALLLVGYAGAFRRSELAQIDLGRTTLYKDGILITFPTSKSDQEGEGSEVAIPRGLHAETCPVLALETWLDRARITSGPVFRGVDRHGRVSPHGLNSDSIARILKRAARRAGFQTAEIAQVAGHSLRAGYVTQALLTNKIPEAGIMLHVRQKSSATLRGYHRPPTFARDAGADLGL